MNDGEPIRKADGTARVDDVYSVRVGLLGATQVLRWRHLRDFGSARGRRRSKADVLEIAQRMRWDEWILLVRQQRDAEESDE